MIVICIRCQRMVGCSTSEGKPIDNCYHCKSRECRTQILNGQAIITQVIISKFKSCLDHDSPHIGFKPNE